jgi:hypothetical protein
LSCQVVDLKFSQCVVKRWVVRYTSAKYTCTKCGFTFLADGYPNYRATYGHGLLVWCVYSSVACGHNINQVGKSLQELFGLRVPQPTLFRFKAVAARQYAPEYDKIKVEVLSGKLLHIDETEVKLKDRKAFVWVLANDEFVYYFFRESREAGFLKELLKDFKGVLVSDFFTGYDSVEVSQQRCLIHLLRDFNDDLRCYPFDSQLGEIARKFAVVLRDAVATIDRYGLSRWHLGKHRKAAAHFKDWILRTEWDSDLALKYQKRVERYADALFTFLEHDGIPWNNNCAENAMKVFARYRRFADGSFTPSSIADYLVLLSLYQTCERRGMSFLRMLLDTDRSHSKHLSI